MRWWRYHSKLNYRADFSPGCWRHDTKGLRSDTKPVPPKFHNLRHSAVDKILLAAKSIGQTAFSKGVIGPLPNRPETAPESISALVADVKRRNLGSAPTTVAVQCLGCQTVESIPVKGGTGICSHVSARRLTTHTTGMSVVDVVHGTSSQLAS